MTTALLGLLELRLGFAESVASQNEIGRGDGNRGNAGVFKSGGEQARGKAFAERRKPIEELGTGGDVTLGRNLVQEIATERIKLTGNAIVVFALERQVAKNIVVKTENRLRFRTSAVIFAVRKGLRDGQKTIRHAFHGGDHDDDLRRFRNRTGPARGMEHALRAEQRASTKFTRDDGFAGSG